MLNTIKYGKLLWIIIDHCEVSSCYVSINSRNPMKSYKILKKLTASNALAVLGTSKCQGTFFQDISLNDLLWNSRTYYDILGHSMTFYDILWHSITFYDLLWHSTMFYDTLWCSLKFYDFLWSFWHSMIYFLWHYMMFCDILWHTMTFCSFEN